MENLVLLGYVIFSYLFEIGASSVPHGSNWYNFLLAPIFMPIKIGRVLAYLSIK